MEKQIKAFPCWPEGLQGPANEGMDLRDYFAAIAMNGLISYGGRPEHTSFISSSAYLIADSMMYTRMHGQTESSSGK